LKAASGSFSYLAVGLEAAKGALGGGERLRVRPLQIAHQRVQRLPEAIDIEAVEADLPPFVEALIVPFQPLGQGHHLPVGPHPSRPAVKGVQNLAGALARAPIALDVAVDAVAVGPVALDGEKGKALFADEALAQSGPPAVVLRGAVGGLAQEDVAGVADGVQ
jgi:hypothetical protein